MGIFTNDYESAGPGIAKNAPKKTGVRLYFEIFIRKFWKIAEVNLLYSLFFVPLIIIFAAVSFIDSYALAMTIIIVMLLTFMITIGPATAGMTKIMRNYVLEKHAFIMHDFFRAFRTNFKKAAVIGFCDCLIVLSAFASLVVYPQLASQYSKILYVPMVITLSLALIVGMMNYYIYLMLTATNLSLKNLIKNSFALAFVALKTNVITSLIIIATSVFMGLFFRYFMPLCVVTLIFFPAAFLCFTAAFNSYPIIQKYVINPYYTSIGQINPEIAGNISDDNEEPIFEDMGGKEKPIEKRKKGKGRRIS